MPRCNLTLKQKCQIIELSNELSTDQLAKKFRVHPTTVTRTLQKKKRIIEQASRVNTNFKTVQTNKRCQEHDALILEYIRSRQEENEPISIKDICDKAVEFAKTLDRSIKSKRGWWRRFKIRCNIIRSKLTKGTNCLADSESQNERIDKELDKKQISKGKQNSKYTFKIRESISQKATAKSVAL